MDGLVICNLPQSDYGTTSSTLISTQPTGPYLHNGWGRQCNLICSLFPSQDRVDKSTCMFLVKKLILLCEEVRSSKEVLGSSYNQCPMSWSHKVGCYLLCGKKKDRYNYFLLDLTVCMNSLSQVRL